MKKAYIRTSNYDLEKVFKNCKTHFSKKIWSMKNDELGILAIELFSGDYWNFLVYYSRNIVWDFNRKKR